MKYTDEQVKKVVQEFVEETGQHEVRYIVSFCLGYFGYITNQIWRAIIEVVDEDGETK